MTIQEMFGINMPAAIAVRVGRSRDSTPAQRSPRALAEILGHMCLKPVEVEHIEILQAKADVLVLVNVISATAGFLGPRKFDREAVKKGVKSVLELQRLGNDKLAEGYTSKLTRCAGLLIEDRDLAVEAIETYTREILDDARGEEAKDAVKAKYHPARETILRTFQNYRQGELPQPRR